MKQEDLKYISLAQAAKMTSYSQDYISLLCRRKKMKGVKLGRNWVTTKKWVQEYIDKTEESAETAASLKMIAKKGKQARPRKSAAYAKSGTDAKNIFSGKSIFSTNQFLFSKKFMLAVIVSGFFVALSAFSYNNVFVGQKVNKLVSAISSGLSLDSLAFNEKAVPAKKNISSKSKPARNSFANESTDAENVPAQANEADTGLENALNLGKIYYGLGKLEKAKEAYLIVVSNYPDSPQAHFGLGLVLQKEGQTEEALKEFKMALVLDPGNQEIASRIFQLDKKSGMVAGASSVK